MPRVQFNVFKSDALTAWGYPIEQTEEGVFGNVPDELLENEIASGRVKTPVKQTPQDVIENGSGKRVGRPAKVAEAVKVEE
jgi:hypothetical protein